jgi:hypothetical protein
MRFRRPLAIAAFIWQRDRAVAIVGIVAFMIAMLCLLNRSLVDWILNTQTILDANWLGNAATGAFSFMTLVVAFFVFLNQKRNDWEESLPRRLWAEFVVDGDLVMLCEDASHIDDGDARSLAMQIGKQMSGGELKLLPMFDFLGPEVLMTEGGWVRRSKIRIHLLEVPIKLAEFRNHHNRPAACYVRWQENGKWLTSWRG